MTEEIKREPESYRVASSEFFFLLQRMDRLDEKLLARMDRIKEKLSSEIRSVSSEIRNISRWGTGLVLAVLGLIISIAVKVWF